LIEPLRSRELLIAAFAKIATPSNSSIFFAKIKRVKPERHSELGCWMPYALTKFALRLKN